MIPLRLIVLLVSVAVPYCYAMTCLHGPCGPGNDMCGPDFDQSSPQFHVRDRSCGENDPNFPFYDPVNKLYHLFYQDHVFENQNGVGMGPDIGHAVSADLVHWTHLPVAVWNDQPYDNVAIYTGSATIVNGTPVMVYPGLCVKSTWPQCNTGTLLAIALPANMSDPFLTNWTKPSYNPIVENTERDPSTAWKTASGEWRFTNYLGKVWWSKDFVTWNSASNGDAIFPVAECPDFFELPPLCEGCTNSSIPPNTTVPTHVHKQSSNGQDWYTLGVYQEGIPGTTGVWTPTPGVPFLQPLDFTGPSGMVGSSSYYASKGFWDPVKGRRIYWGWAIVAPASTQTLPRVVTYDPEVMMLRFNPLPELKTLRVNPPLFQASAMSVPGGLPIWLGDWSNNAGNQSEVVADFDLSTVPSGRVVFGLQLLVSSQPHQTNNVSVSIEFAYDSNHPTVVNTSVYIPTQLSYFMPGTDLPGGDYNVTNVNYNDPHICQSVCTADTKCVAYTYVVRPPLVGSCCLKSTVPSPNPNPTCTSGVKPSASNVKYTTVRIPSRQPKRVDVKAYIDNTFLEVFVLGGRAAFTFPIPSSYGKGSCGVNVYSSSSIGVKNVQVWKIGSIWTSKENVLLQRK